jgi:hypothetical protein
MELLNSLPAATVAQMGDMMSRRLRLLDSPSPQPTTHECPSPPAVIAPHIPIRRYKQFTGHRFGLGYQGAV